MGVRIVKIFWLPAIVLMQGCATAARVEQMVVTPTSAAATTKPTGVLLNNVRSGEVMGGKDTNPLWESEIGNDDFRAALRKSLTSAS